MISRSNGQSVAPSAPITTNRLDILAGIDSISSLASLRAQREDGTQILEGWSALTAWSPNNSAQVLANKCYPISAGALAGASQAMAIPATGRFRMVANVTKQGSQTGTLVGIGLTQIANGGPMTNGAPNTIILGLQAGVASVFSTLANPSGVLHGGPLVNTAGSGSGTVLPDGDYTLTLCLDETDLSFSLVDSAHTLEYEFNFRRSILTTQPFTGIVFWNSGSLGTSGNALQPLGAANTSNTMVPRTNVEGLGDSVYGNSNSNSQTFAIRVPKSYDSRLANPLVLYFHGSTDNAQTPFKYASLRPVTQALLDAGYIVASSDGHGNNWGNQDSLDDTYTLYKYVRDHYSIGPVLILSQSMGGLGGLSTILAQDVPGIVGWAGIYPCCNLRALYDGGSLTTPIKQAYGIASNGSDYDSKTAGYDPALYLGNKFRGVGMRFYASPGDTLVPKATNSDLIARKVARYALESEVVVCSGDHGDPSHFQPSDVLAFFDRCIGA